VTGQTVGEWVWALAFFPLWLVTAVTLFGLVAIPKRTAGVRGRKYLDAAALLLSIGTSAGALMWLDCSAYIHLPLTESACRVSNLFI
jgi:hypothetical protein